MKQDAADYKTEPQPVLIARYLLNLTRSFAEWNSALEISWLTKNKFEIKSRQNQHESILLMQEWAIIWFKARMSNLEESGVQSDLTAHSKWESQVV